MSVVLSNWIGGFWARMMLILAQHHSNFWHLFFYNTNVFTLIQALLNYFSLMNGLSMFLTLSRIWPTVPVSQACWILFVQSQSCLKLLKELGLTPILWCLVWRVNWCFCHDELSPFFTGLGSFHNDVYFQTFVHQDLI